MVAPRRLLLMALSSLGLCGCAASWQDLHYAAVNKTRAEYSWYSSTSMSDRWNCGSDYAYGYKSGYYDKATGKACTLPAVPPPCYWSTKYQCCDGQKHIQDWYRGYQCGVAAAEGSGYPYFHDVPIGPQAPVINKDGCGACYAPTGCLCEDVVTPEATVEGQVPEIPHLSSSSQSELAASVVQPVYQASAVSVQIGAQNQASLGLIGPTGAAELSSPTATSVSTPVSTPVVMTGLIGPTGSAELPSKTVAQPSTTAGTRGLIGPSGLAEMKTKVGTERARTADASASAKQPMQR